MRWRASSIAMPSGPPAAGTTSLPSVFEKRRSSRPIPGSPPGSCTTTSASGTGVGDTAHAESVPATSHRWLRCIVKLMVPPGSTSVASSARIAELARSHAADTRAVAAAIGVRRALAVARAADATGVAGADAVDTAFGVGRTVLLAMTAELHVSARQSGLAPAVVEAGGTDRLAHVAEQPQLDAACA